MRQDLVDFFYQYIGTASLLVPYQLEIISLGLILGTFYGFRRLSSLNIELLAISKFYFVGYFAMFVGGRIAWMILNQKFSLEDLIFGGYSVLGALITVAATGWIILHKWLNLDTDFGLVLDAVTPGALVAFIFARIGCFIQGCCFGIATNLPMAVSFPKNTAAYSTQLANGLISSQADRSLMVHPAQLYEAIGLLIILSIFIFLEKHTTKLLHGSYSIFAFVSYGFLRFLLEFLRGDARSNFGLVNNVQMTILLMVTIVLFSYVFMFHDSSEKAIL